jgi:hypothetical protein
MVPTSHQFIERPIGTVRREDLDRVLFWNSVDLTRKLNAFRAHRSLDGAMPAQRAGMSSPAPAVLHSYAWEQHCQGLFQSPMAA